MSSRSDRLRPLGAAALFALLMLASSYSYSLDGASKAPRPASRTEIAKVEAGLALLAPAHRPMMAVTFCEPLRGYLPTLLPVGAGGAPMRDTPPRPAILCTEGAVDLGAAAVKAQAQGLGWSARIKGTTLIAFSRDEAAFRRVLAEAGAPMDRTVFEPYAPLLHALRPGRPGVEPQGEGWRALPSADPHMVLFGPFVDLPAGDYRVTAHVRLEPGPGGCAAALASARMALAVTADGGRRTVRDRTPLPPRPGRACDATLEDRFSLPAAATLVETPLYLTSDRPLIVDGYGLAPAAAAQSR